jgi:FlaA1/EpsC-like NDP-sugar epimerase
MTLPSPVVIAGAGSLGQRVAKAVHPVLFYDNNSSLWGAVCEGVPVESPAATVKGYPNAMFIVAIWRPSRTRTA